MRHQSPSVLSSKIYDIVQDHNLDLAPISRKLIMGDGRTIRPLGIACNINVIISRKCIPTDFFVIDAYHSNHGHIILGRPFLKLVDAVLDAGEGKVILIERSTLIIFFTFLNIVHLFLPKTKK
jgi:hypothetical protein